ncbi:FAD/NAD(P)-binding protein [Phyllobacterium sophorae]|uniref:FAD/NAD(P)-binding protein n=1 Tax=Phyllobacterium sophorae TaxID=1520277 RepID=UPI0014756DCF|nr:FAD-dependent oxidoreductase [Phyllobacterium sophorae]
MTAVVVAIIGGGFSGTAIAYHLAAQTQRRDIEIVVIEPRERPGGGLAYSSKDLAHRINVPAAKMTMISAEPEHFTRWLAKDAASVGDVLARTAKGDEFPQRSVFGRYVHNHVEPFLETGRIRHERATALSIRPVGERYSIVLTGEGNVDADIVVIATSHPLPSVPGALRPLIGSPRFIADPYAEDTLLKIEQDHAVLVIGTGLTAADVIASLDRSGHRGDIVALSRHGYRSRGHAAQVAEPFGSFGNDETASSLLISVRHVLKEAQNQGLAWHPVLDALRDQAPAIWAALPSHERRRLVRHLRGLWDVHRFRIAPQVEDVLDRRLREGTLQIIAASLHSAHETSRRFNVSYRRRYKQSLEKAGFDAIVITTGPAHATIAQSNPVVRSLFDQGLLASDPIGLGLHTAKSGQAIGNKGEIARNLFIGGPLARGTFGELMGVPEVTRYAEFIAERVKERALEALLHDVKPLSCRG